MGLKEDGELLLGSEPVKENSVDLPPVPPPLPCGLEGSMVWPAHEPRLTIIVAFKLAAQTQLTPRSNICRSTITV